MTQEKLNEALELIGKADEADRQAIGLKTKLEIASDATAPEQKFTFHFGSKSVFAIPILKGLIEVFENQKDRYELEFSKL